MTKDPPIIVKELSSLSQYTAPVVAELLLKEIFSPIKEPLHCINAPAYELEVPVKEEFLTARVLPSAILRLVVRATFSAATTLLAARADATVE